MAHDLTTREPDLLLGRFRLGERIGSGGMGTVYRGFDERLRRDVAIKEIPGADSDRVLREAQAAARLSHPGIATVYELGRHAGSALLVSELVPGPTLAEARAQHRLTDRDVAAIGADLCEALHHAHAAGVVHRDVKPQNVIVCQHRDRGRRAKLMDFGIARLAGAPALTATGEVLGTLAYMAPEQSDGLEAGPAADVYSLALTLYECWAGVNPVAGATPAETARRIGAPIPPLGTVRRDLDPGLAAAIDACLRADPADRLAPAQLRAALRAARDGLDASRPVPAPDPEREPSGGGRFGFARIAAALAVATSLAAVWGLLDAPGLALVAAVLVAPALVFLPGLGPFVPPAAAALAAAGAAGAYPAAAAHAGHRAAARALAGALGWWWALAAAIGLGAGSTLGLASSAPAGWEGSAQTAASEVLVPLVAPAALAGSAAFALAAATLGWILGARHIALAALGALLWAATLVAGLGLLADASLGERPLAIALAAAGAVAYEHRRRTRASARFEPASARPGATESRPAVAPGTGAGPDPRAARRSALETASTRI